MHGLTHFTYFVYMFSQHLCLEITSCLSLSIFSSRIFFIHHSVIPLFSHSIKPSLSLSLSLSHFILRGVPDPIHSSLFKTVDPLSAFTLRTQLSLTSHPCVSQPLSHQPPRFHFLSFSSLFCLAPTYRPRGAIDKQAGVL